MKKTLVVTLIAAFALTACNDDLSKKMAETENKVTQLEASIAAKDESLKQLHQTYEELKTQYDLLKEGVDKQGFPGLHVEAKPLFDKTESMPIKEDNTEETTDVSYTVFASTMTTPYDWLNQLLLKALWVAADDTGESTMIPDVLTEEDVSKAYEKIFETFKKDIIDVGAIVGSEKTAEIRYIGQRGDLLTFSLHDYLFEGGAHGMPSTRYINVNANKKAVVSLNDLVQKGNINQLKDVLWQVYQQRQDMLGTEPIVKKTDFRVSDNFYFVSDGIVFVYPVYELAPFSEGEVELLASYQEINSLLTKDYQQTAKDGFREIR